MTSAMSVIGRLEMQFRSCIKANPRPALAGKQQSSSAKANAVTSGSEQVTVQDPLRAARPSNANRGRSHFVEYTRSNMG